MKYAVTLAEELHFGRAASREFTSQATFSEQIQRLERDLGVLLFARTSRSVRVTPAGAVVLHQIRRALDAFDEVSATAARAGRGQVGRLAIGLSAVAIDVTPGILRSFGGGHPDVEMVVEQFPFMVPAAGVDTGRADVGLVWAPLDDAGLDREVLMRLPRVAVLPEDHPLADSDELMIEKLLDDVWCDCPSPDAVWKSFWLADDHRNGVPARLGASASSLEGLLELAAAGQGVMLAPAGIRRLQIPGVRYVTLSDVQPCEVSVAWPRGQENPLVRAFVACAQSVAGVIEMAGDASTHSST